MRLRSLFLVILSTVLIWLFAVFVVWEATVPSLIFSLLSISTCDKPGLDLTDYNSPQARIHSSSTHIISETITISITMFFVSRQAANAVVHSQFAVIQRAPSRHLYYHPRHPANLSNGFIPLDKG